MPTASSAAADAVLELGELLEEVVGDGLGRGLRDSLQAHEGDADVLPEVETATA